MSNRKQRRDIRKAVEDRQKTAYEVFLNMQAAPVIIRARLAHHLIWAADLRKRKRLLKKRKAILKAVEKKGAWNK